MTLFSNLFKKNQTRKHF